MATEAKHTPGPWSYRPAKYDDWGFVRAEPPTGETLGHLVAVAKDSTVRFEDYDAHRANGTDPFEANGRLIAAAPDMLEALRAVHNCGNGGAKLSRTASDMTRRAIAKAEGR